MLTSLGVLEGFTEIPRISPALKVEPEKVAWYAVLFEAMSTPTVSVAVVFKLAVPLDAL